MVINSNYLLFGFFAFYGLCELCFNTYFLNTPILHRLDWLSCSCSCLVSRLKKGYFSCAPACRLSWPIVSRVIWVFRGVWPSRLNAYAVREPSFEAFWAIFLFYQYPALVKPIVKGFFASSAVKQL